MPTAKRNKPREDDPLRWPFDPRIIRKAEALAARSQLMFWGKDGHWFGHGLEMPGCMGDGKTITTCERVPRRSRALGVATMLDQR